MILDGASYRVFFINGKISLSKTPSIESDESDFLDLVVSSSKNIVKITKVNNEGFAIVSEQATGKDKISVRCGDVTKVIETVVYGAMNKMEINPATYFSYPLLNGNNQLCASLYSSDEDGSVEVVSCDTIRKFNASELKAQILQQKRNQYLIGEDF